jgi:prenyltransferase beta subunit
LQTLRRKVSILLNHGIDFNRQEIIKWVQLCQNGDGGFGFYPGTTSFMENTYCALEILAKLGSSPVQTELCQRYILSCQTKNGGFGRAPASFPFIESTFHAVMGLLLLEKMGGGET